MSIDVPKPVFDSRESCTSTPRLQSPEAIPERSPETETGPETTSSPGPKHQAAFVSKLYQMVSDPTTDHLIRWGPNGDSFVVLKPEDFAKGLCSLFFKHNNWQSFVRQLNMYQFHKVNDVFHSNGGSGTTSAWEFKHALFRHGCVDALTGIKRKASKPAPHSRDPYPLHNPRDIPRSYQNSPVEEVTMQEHPHQAQHVQQRISSIEESQRILMNQTLALFSTLHSYQNVLQGMANVLASTHASPSTQAIQNDIYALSQQLQQAQYSARAQQQHTRPHGVNNQWQNMSPRGHPQSPSQQNEPDSYFRIPLNHSPRDSSTRPPTPSLNLQHIRPGPTPLVSPHAHQIPTPPLSDTSGSSRVTSTSNVRDHEHHLPPLKHQAHLHHGHFSPPLTSPGPTSNGNFPSRPKLDRGHSLQSLLNVAGAASAEMRQAEDREDDRKRPRLDS